MVPVLVAFKTPVICRVCHLAKHRLKLAGGMGLPIGSAKEPLPTRFTLNLRLGCKPLAYSLRARTQLSPTVPLKAEPFVGHYWERSGNVKGNSILPISLPCSGTGSTRIK